MNDRFKFRVWWEKEHRYRVDAKIHPIEKFFRKEFVIEQCTGLKDKNGKLIYEGDIVEDGCVKRTVMWNGWYWNAKARTNCPLDNITCSIVEIVGNIHEQAEQQDNGGNK